MRHRDTLRQAAIEGGLAALLSTLAMAWRGQRERGSGFAALNAPSQWLHGREAVHREAPDGRHTPAGLIIHAASAQLWSAFYAALQSRRARTTTRSEWLDAALVASLAATVDLALVPERLTPGFQHRMGRVGLLWVYGSFAAGLALGAWACRLQKDTRRGRGALRS